MNKQRILPYTMATKINKEEAEKVSGAGTSYATLEATYSPVTGSDVRGDITYDM